jgi:hypothetical protein
MLSHLFNSIGEVKREYRVRMGSLTLVKRVNYLKRAEPTRMRFEPHFIAS